MSAHDRMSGCRSHYKDAIADAADGLVKAVELACPDALGSTVLSVLTDNIHLLAENIGKELAADRDAETEVVEEVVEESDSDDEEVDSGGDEE